MAQFFIAYKSSDREIAHQLQASLEALGHIVRLDTNSMSGGAKWRESLTDALIESDAVIALITEESIQSPFVVAEIGAARALARTPKQMVLIPIVLGDMEIPLLVQDLGVICIRDARQLRSKAGEIDKAIKKHLPKRDEHRGPKLFISHRHKDEKIASALVDVLRSAFTIAKTDIRCTSVPPYCLPGGTRVPDQLRAELASAEAVIGIITPDSKDSSYVLFELGGAWAQKIHTFPTLARGATTADLPDPIRDLNPLSLENARNCEQFLDDLEHKITLKRQSGVTADVGSRIRRLVTAAKQAAVVPAPKSKTKPVSRKRK